MSGETYIESYYKLKHIIESDIFIDTIVLEIDPQSLSSSMRRSDRIFDELNIYSQYAPIPVIAQYRNASVANIIIHKLFPVIGNGKEFQYLITQPNYRKIIRGWINDSSAMTQEKALEDAKLRYQQTFEGESRIDKDIFTYLLMTIELAQKNNIRIVYITYPHTTAFKEVISEYNISNDQYYQVIFKYLQKEQEEIVYLNYYDFMSSEYQLFSDSTHLNEEGAVIFSKQLFSDLAEQTRESQT